MDDIGDEAKSIKSFIRSIIRTLGNDVHKVDGPEAERICFVTCGI